MKHQTTLEHSSMVGLVPTIVTDIWLTQKQSLKIIVHLGQIILIPSQVSQFKILELENIHHFNWIDVKNIWKLMKEFCMHNWKNFCDPISNYVQVCSDSNNYSSFHHNHTSSKWKTGTMSTWTTSNISIFMQWVSSWEWLYGPEQSSSLSRYGISGPMYGISYNVFDIPSLMILDSPLNPM